MKKDAFTGYQYCLMECELCEFRWWVDTAARQLPWWCRKCHRESARPSGWYC
jgi:hypothetical protein